MAILNDKSIRPRLKKFLAYQSKSSIKVIDEFHINFGAAIADIVLIDRYMHCFEIKGQTDKIQRIESQGKILDTSFPKITLVTTENHIEYALKKTPKHWGIIKVFFEEKKMKFIDLRPAKLNPNFDKEVALFSLWKSELIEFSLNNKFNIIETMNKKAISEMLSKSLSAKKINEGIADIISKRIKLRNLSA